MAYTDPTIRATGELITAAIYNADIVSNFKYLGGIAGVATSPPGSPVSGQRWVYELASGEHWQFVYRPDLDGTYPWHFIGGPSHGAEVTPAW